MSEEKLALDDHQSRNFAALALEVEQLDENYAEVLATSKADPEAKAYVHRFLERVVALLESLGVAGPLPKSEEMLGTTRSERARAWLRRNRWHLLAYTGLAATVLVLLWQLSGMHNAIEENRALINATNIEVLQHTVHIQEQLKELLEKGN